MHNYIPPLEEMRFLLTEIAPLRDLPSMNGDGPPDEALSMAILEEAAKFAQAVLAPLNSVGDRQGVTMTSEGVETARGWKEAYGQFVDAGWNSLAGPVSAGGQSLPQVVIALAEEIWNSTNMAFALCPMLTKGAVEALQHCGSKFQQDRYLAKLVSGEWAGTMNLTEGQAGSDLAAIKTRALPQEDGSYRLFGQKIFITYGEHDLTDNIVHLVLARASGSPEGVKGISLFLVPKFLLDEDGRPGQCNDVRCVSVEHKLGIHGSPTAVLAFGDKQGATGWLVGELNQGLRYMFVMMNAARFSVGVEGLGLCERAAQNAVAYARERVQGTDVGSSAPAKVVIAHHGDVQRMLASLTSRTQAIRAVTCAVAHAMDLAKYDPDPEVRRKKQGFVELMIPIVKGWNTETAVWATSTNLQIHGGMGYVEETGAAQLLRDARITTIYEGTTGIQAADFLTRKIVKDEGAAIRVVQREILECIAQLEKEDDESLQVISAGLSKALSAMAWAVNRVLVRFHEDPKGALFGSVPLLELVGWVVGGWQLGRSALAAHRRLASDDPLTKYLSSKVMTARFYCEHLLAQTESLAAMSNQGSASAAALVASQE